MKPVKGIVGKIFSRFVIMVVLILIQTGWIALAYLSWVNTRSIHRSHLMCCPC